MELKISTKDCEAIILKYRDKHCDVKDYQIIPLDTKLGLLGDYFKLKIKFVDREEEEKQFFVKTIANAECQKRFSLTNGAVGKEETFYSKFVPLCLEKGVDIIQDCIAKCYLIKTLDMMVFDDLSVAGYRIVCARSTLSLKHIELALGVFAKLHGSSYVLEEVLTRQNGRVYRITDDFQADFKEVLYNDNDLSQRFMRTQKLGIRAHLELFKYKLNNIRFQALIDGMYKIVDAFSLYVKPSARYRNVLCHGDLWNTNIMFKHQKDVPTDAKMVDFQIYRYCPPTMDLVTFLYFCTNRKFRRYHYEHCLKFYYDQLSKVLRIYHLDLENIFSKEEFMESAEYYKKFAVCQTSTYGQVTMIDHKLLSNIISDSDGVGEMMFGDRTDVIVHMSENDDVYKQKMWEIFEDLTEVILEQ